MKLSEILTVSDRRKEYEEVRKILREMQRLSRAELFESLPNPKRRKRLTKKVPGFV